jgi:phosphoribosyl 1,2-cyclic phosphodiesterase
VRVTFWGTRGSLPVALTSAGVQDKLVAALVQAAGRNLDTEDKAREFIESELPFTVSHTFGGHSSCVQIVTESEEYVVCDLGSGARPFGQYALASRGGRPAVYNVFMSHPHWDHIMGFPFFMPSYLPGNRIRIHGCHADLEPAFRRQHGPPSFPVEFSRLGAAVEFVRLEPDRTYEIAGLRVTPKRQHHSGDSYGYRFEADGRSVVYSTDSEHKLDDPKLTQEFVEFFRDADLVICDAMYSLADAVSIKEDWGHSSNVVAVEICQMARAKHLVLFHHEPMNDDEKLARVLRESVRLEEITRGEARLRISVAWDGMDVTL